MTYQAASRPGSKSESLNKNSFLMVLVEVLAIIFLNYLFLELSELLFLAVGLTGKR